MTAYDVRAKAAAARALDLIANGGKGQAVTITTPFVGVYDPATDTTTTGAATTHDGSGIEEAYSAYSIAQGLVGASDVKFLLSPLKTNGADMPQPVADRDTLTKADGVWAIKNVDPLSPAGFDVMFTLRLARS